jgi:hypothetical protein
MVGAWRTFPSLLPQTTKVRRRARGMKKNLIVLVTLVMVAVVAFETLDASNAEARKRKPPSPPNYNFVFCQANETCLGTPSADLLVATGDQFTRGAAGNDIYMDSDGIHNSYVDQSTSSDLYGGFLNDQFDEDFIDDRGGVDRVDLSYSHASTDFEFFKDDFDGDGALDDLDMDEKNLGNNDNLIVFNHFGSGRIESIKFSDKTLSGANLPLS